jgi:hypothetical protein
MKAAQESTHATQLSIPEQPVLAEEVKQQDANQASPLKELENANNVRPFK